MTDHHPRRSGLLAVGATVGLWTALTWAAAASVDRVPWATSIWGHYDSAHYLSIAERGYVLGPCIDVANRTPDDWCGNAGWFPLLPAAMRSLGAAGVDLALAGRLVALAAFVATVAVLWWGFLRRCPARLAAPVMALVAVFPGSIYYGAIFPISLVTLSTVGALALVDRRRWFAAGAVGGIATMAYTSGLLVGALALVPLCMSSLGGWRRRIGAAAAVGAPVAVAYGAVLANFERTVGRWNAAALVQASYDHEFTWPIATWREQARRLVHVEALAWSGVQTLVVAALVTLAVGVAVRHRRQSSPGEWGALLLGIVFWIAPLTLGPKLSIYRAEALVLPTVILLARADRRVTWFAVACAAPVAFAMARLFFTAVLV